MRIRIFITLFISLALTGCIGYEKDGDTVYYKSWNEGSGGHKNRLAGADPNTFKILKHDSYAKDRRQVYYKGELVKGADAETFESLGDFYARDKNRGYYGGDSIRSSKGSSFRVIDAYYSTDGVDVFYTTNRLGVCSAKDFRFVYADEEDWKRWTTDGCFYFYKHYRVPSDDYKNIQLFKDGAGFAKDEKHVYFKGRIINYGEDGKKILDTVDVATFTETDYLDCRDKFGCINPYRGRKPCK